jgi:hypothetical protein
LSLQTRYSSCLSQPRRSSSSPTAEKYVVEPNRTSTAPSLRTLQGDGCVRPILVQRFRPVVNSVTARISVNSAVLPIKPRSGAVARQIYNDGALCLPEELRQSVALSGALQPQRQEQSFACVSRHLANQSAHRQQFGLDSWPECGPTAVLQSATACQPANRQTLVQSNTGTSSHTTRGVLDSHVQTHQRFGSPKSFVGRMARGNPSEEHSLTQDSRPRTSGCGFSPADKRKQYPY